VHVSKRDIFLPRLPQKGNGSELHFPTFAYKFTERRSLTFISSYSFHTVVSCLNSCALSYLGRCSGQNWSGHTHLAACWLYESWKSGYSSGLDSKPEILYASRTEFICVTLLYSAQTLMQNRNKQTNSLHKVAFCENKLLCLHFFQIL